MKNALVTIAVVTTAACCIGVTGCGTATTNATTHVERTTPDAITIGLLSPRTGSASRETRDGANAVDAWVKSRNAAGGIGGRNIRLITADTVADSPTALAAARKLVQHDHVSVLVSDDPATESAYASYTAAEEIPVIGVGRGAAWATRTNWFATGPVAPLDAAAEVTGAKAVGAVEFAVVGCTEDPTCVSSSNDYAAAARSQGLRYGGLVDISQNSPSDTSTCLAFRAKHVDFIEIGLGGGTGEQFAANCRRAGYQGQFGLGETTADFGDYAGTTLPVSGILAGFPWFAADPSAQRYVAAMRKYEPGIPVANPTATGLWAALELFGLAAARATETTSATTVLTALHSVTREDLHGLLAQPVTYPHGKPSPQVHCFWVYQVRGGRTQIVPPTGAAGNSATSRSLASTCVGTA